jgi:hypothetical protein
VRPPPDNSILPCCSKKGGGFCLYQQAGTNTTSSRSSMSSPSQGTPCHSNSCLPAPAVCLHGCHQQQSMLPAVLPFLWEGMLLLTCSLHEPYSLILCLCTAG